MKKQVYHLSCSQYDFMKLKRLGFTLIELLVVISVISLLVAILLPSLKKAKDLAKLVTCASNMRQIQLCNMLYAEDHGKYWTTKQYSNGNGWLMVRPLHPETMELTQYAELTDETAQNVGVFDCPAARHIDAGSSFSMYRYEGYERTYHHTYPDMWYFAMSSAFSMKDKFSAEFLGQLSPGKVQRPDAALAFLDWDGEHEQYENTEFGKEWGLRNYVFADGHVDSFEFGMARP